MRVGNDNRSPVERFGALAVGYDVLNLLVEQVGVEPMRLLLSGQDQQVIAQALGERAIGSVRGLSEPGA